MGSRVLMAWLGLFSVLLYSLVQSRPLRLQDYERSSMSMTPATKLLESWGTTCTSNAPLPADVAAYLGCLNVQDLTKLVGSEISKLITSDSNPSSITKIMDDMVSPLESVVSSIVAAAGISKDDNVCFGNWEASELDFDGCGNIPLQQDSSFTVLSMSVDMPIAAVCDQEGAATFCIAVSICPETYLPTVAVNVGGVTLACIAEKLEEVDEGVTTIATEAAEFSIESVGFGLSLGQQFATDLNIYTALSNSEYSLLTNTLQGMYYEQVDLDITPTEWLGIESLPDILSFQGIAVQTMAVSGLNSGTLDNVFSTYKAQANSDGSITSAIGNSFLTLAEDVSLQFGMKIDLSMTIDFSEMNNTLSKILPDTGTIQLGEADAFMQTATTNTDVNGTAVALPGGVYVFTGIGAIANTVAGLVNYVLQFAQSIINLGGDWLPFDLSSASDFIKKITDSIDDDDAAASPDNELGFGFAATEDNFGLFLNLPLIFADLGFFRVECTFTWAQAELHCSLKTDLNSHFWKAIAEVTKEGVLWLARETDETFTKLGNVIAAGLEDATSEASAFAEENVKETVSMIKSGAIELSGDIKTELDNWASWGETVFGDWKDEVSEIATEAIHTAATAGEDAVQAAEKVWESAKSTFEDAAANLENAFGCGEGSIISTLTGCTDCCEGLNNTEKWLAEAGGDVDQALESAWKDVQDVVDDVASFIYSSRSSFTYSSFDPEQYDSIYGCEKLKVYETEEEKILGIVVHKSTKYVGATLDTNCIHSRLTSTQTVQDRYEVESKGKEQYEQSLKDNANAIYGSTLTSSELLDAGFTCDPPVLNRNSTVAGQVPVTVTCSSLPIDSEGAFGGATVSASETRTIGLSEYGTSAAADIVALQTAVANALAAKITAGFKTES